MPYAYPLSCLTSRAGRITTYHCDPQMYAAVCQKPEHECPFRRKHIWILLGLLYVLLCLCELRPIAARYMLLEPSTVRGRIEFRGSLEDSRLRRGSSGR